MNLDRENPESPEILPMSGIIRLGSWAVKL
jgi:hypothetical protein